MRSNLSYKGEWHIPGASDRKCIGTLIFNYQDGASLDLVGELTERTNGPESTEVILGFTTTGKAITLYSNVLVRRTMNLPGSPTTTWSANYVIEGGHFSAAEEINFSSASVSFYNLNEWLAINGFHIENKFGVGAGTTLDYSIPEDIDFKVRDDIEGKFKFTYRPPGAGWRYEIKIKQTAHFHIAVADGELRFREILGLVGAFQSFLSLGAYEATYPIKMTCQSKTIVEKVDDIEFPTNYNVYYKSVSKQTDGRAKILWEFLFNYKDIEHKFPSVIRKWYENQDNILPVMNILNETFISRGKFNENRFLNIVQALETFHRRRRRNAVIDEELHIKRLKAINDAIPPEHKKFLSERLMHSNEPSLKSRLISLIDEFTTSTFNKVVRDKAAFVKQVGDSRNYYTHYDPKMKSKAVHGADLYYCTERLKIILVSAVLHDCGFGLDLIEQLLERNEYKFFNHVFEPD